MTLHDCRNHNCFALRTLVITCGTDLDAMLVAMDHLEVLREKIASLRVEIAQLQELNHEYRRGNSRNDPQAQIAHTHRHERLEAIQQELVKVADLGRRVRTIEQVKEQHRSGSYLAKKAS